MASTTINISISAGLLIPDVSSVPIVAGDSITFNAPEDDAIKLCLSTGTPELLGTPDETQIDAGGTLTLTFASGSASGHGIALQYADKRRPGKIGVGAAGTLSIEAARKGAAPIPDNPDEPPVGNPGSEG